METVLIQINNSKAYKLLEDLEDLNLITLLKRSTYSDQKLSEKYSGKLPSEVAEELQEFVSHGRDEWKQNTI